MTAKTTGRHIPLRRCAVCGEQAPKRELARIVRRPDGSVALDPGGKLAGRGAYLCARAACRAQAQRTGRLAHALRLPSSEQSLKTVLSGGGA